MTDIKGKALPAKIAGLVEAWTDRKELYRETFGPGWPAKHVTTSFVFEGEKYELGPESFAKEEIAPNMYCWESGLMECYQRDLEKDLKELGAAEIYSLGFLD